MIAAAGYYLRLLTYRQAVLAPAGGYFLLVAAIYAGPAGPPLQAAAVTAVALMPVTAWLVRLAATAESQPFAEITLATLGGPLRRQAARLAATLCVAAVLATAAIIWAALTDPEPYPAPTVVTMVGMHAAEALAGAGVGMLIAPPLRTRAGTAIAAVTGLTVVSLVVPWLPPLNPLLRAVYQHPSPGPALLAVITCQAAAVGAAAALAGAALIRRR
jgi:hypothetical protein